MENSDNDIAKNLDLNKNKKIRRMLFTCFTLTSIVLLICLSLYLSFDVFIIPNSSSAKSKKVPLPNQNEYVTKKELLDYLSKNGNTKKYEDLVNDIEKKFKVIENGFNTKLKESSYKIRFDSTNKEYPNYYQVVNEINKDIIERTNKYSRVKEIKNEKSYLLENYRSTLKHNEMELKAFIKANMDPDNDNIANDFVLGDYVNYKNNYEPINKENSFHVGYMIPEKPLFIDNQSLFTNYDWSKTVWKNKNDLKNYFISQLINTEKNKEVLGSYIIKFQKDNEDIFTYTKTYRYQDEFDLLNNEEKKKTAYNEWLKQMDNLNTNSLKIKYRTSYGANGFKYWNKYRFIQKINEVEDYANVKLVTITDITNLGYDKTFFENLPGFISFLKLKSSGSRTIKSVVLKAQEFKTINPYAIENNTNLYAPKKGKFSIKTNANNQPIDYFYEGLLVKEIDSKPTWINLTINNQKITLPVYTINNWSTKKKTRVEDLFEFDIDNITNLINLKNLKEKNTEFLKNEKSYLPLFSHALRIIDNNPITDKQKEFREIGLTWKNNYPWSEKMTLLSPFGAASSFKKSKHNNIYNTFSLEEGLDEKASSIILPIDLTNGISIQNRSQDFYAYVLEKPNEYWKFKNPSIHYLPNDVTLTHEYDIIYNNEVIKTIPFSSKLFINKNDQNDDNDDEIYDFETNEFRDLVFQENNTSITKILKDSLNIDSFSFIKSPPIPIGRYTNEILVDLFEDLAKEVTLYNDKDKDNWSRSILSKTQVFTSIKIQETLTNERGKNFYLNKFPLYTYLPNEGNYLNDLFQDAFLHKYYQNNNVDFLFQELLKTKPIIWENLTTLSIESKDGVYKKNIVFNNLILGLLKSQVDLQNLYDYLIIKTE